MDSISVAKITDLNVSGCDSAPLRGIIRKNALSMNIPAPIGISAPGQTGFH